MKRILFLLFIAALFPITATAQYATNSAGWISADGIQIKYAGPELKFIWPNYPTAGTTTEQLLMTPRFHDGGWHPEITMFGDLCVGGLLRVSGNILADADIYATNLWVSGTIHSSTNLLWVTNTFYSTNVYYLTNTASISVDMNKAYGNLDFTGGSITFSGMDNATFSTTAYQTAVVLLRNANSGTITNTPITWTLANMDGLHYQGSPNVTNMTACSFFYDPSVPFTNVIFVPLW